MKYLIMFLMSVNVYGAELLVNTPLGYQEVITVGAGGGYFDQSRVLWDDRVDGPLPGIPPESFGGMTRVGDRLVFSQAVKDAHDAVIASQKSVEDVKKAKVNKLKEFKLKVTLSNKELEEAVLLLLERVD